MATICINKISLWKGKKKKTNPFFLLLLFNLHINAEFLDDICVIWLFYFIFFSHTLIWYGEKKTLEMIQVEKKDAEK